jgi:hypothetical protein
MPKRLKGSALQKAAYGGAVYNRSHVFIHEDWLPSGSSVMKLAGPVVLGSASINI